MASGQHTSENSDNDAAIVLGFITVFSLLGYYLFESYLRSLFNYIGSWMLYPLAKLNIGSTIVEDYYSCLNGINTIWMAQEVVFYYYRWPFIAIMIYFAYRLRKNNIQAIFTEVWTIFNLIHHHAKLHPCMMPSSRAIKKNILSWEIRVTGGWAKSLQAEEMANKHGVKTPIKIDDEKNTKKAKKAIKGEFEKQLGRPFTTLTSLKKEEQVLMVAFIYFIKADKRACELYLDNISKHYLEPADKYGIAKFPYNKKQITQFFKTNNQLINTFIVRHRYPVTILLAMLYQARKKGLLPPVMFLWLRTCNRPLWYALHQLPPTLPGEKVRTKRILIEAAGVHSHYKAEVLSGKRIDEPYIEPAIKGFIEEITEIEL